MLWLLPTIVLYCNLFDEIMHVTTKDQNHKYV